jgi:hypothetical protein
MNLTQALDCYFLNLKENSKRLTSVEAVDPICHDQLGQRKVRLIDLCVLQSELVSSIFHLRVVLIGGIS